MTTGTNKSEYAQALQYLTRALAVRDHSRQELREKMIRRFEAALVERAILEAETNGWLGTDEQIAARAEELYRRRLKSRRYIEAQLLKKGLPLPENDPEVELQTARQLLEKKFGPIETLSYDDKGKASRYMNYQGFDDRTIQRLLGE